MSQRIPLTVTGDAEEVTLTIEQLRIKAIETGAKVYMDTTANWNKQLTYVPERASLIVYSDRYVVYDGVGNPKFIPGLKVGDGNAYVIDLPFIDQSAMKALTDHINDPTAHVSNADRNFWDNKLNYTLSGETLTFNRD